MDAIASISLGVNAIVDKWSSVRSHKVYIFSVKTKKLFQIVGGAMEQDMKVSTF